jgi:hypothetical protein
LYFLFGQRVVVSSGCFPFSDPGVYIVTCAVVHVCTTGEGEGFRTDEQVYDEMYAYFKNNRKGRRKHHHKMAFYLSAGKRQRIRKEIATEHRRQEDAARALASGRVPEKGEPLDGICCCSLRWSQAISGAAFSVGGTALPSVPLQLRRKAIVDRRRLAFFTTKWLCTVSLIFNCRRTCR